jgi:hypothetical protein
MFSKHVTKDISAYCHGELSSEESKLFAEHIISCVKCRTKFEEIKLGIKLAEQLSRLSAPDSLWQEVDSLLGKEPSPVRIMSWPKRMAIAAAVIVVFSLGIFWVYYSRKSPVKGWQVTRLGGAPRIGSETISSGGSLEIGEWLETDANSRARIAVGLIGNVEIAENTRVRLLATRPTEHRLELAQGKMSARIWAPPRLFFVDTPSAVAADLGCAYTLEVNDKGAGRLRVTSGWVALQAKDRESIVPAGASCETEVGVGPGTPYFDDATPEFQNALRNFDKNSGSRSEAVASMLGQSRARDTLTLWHLLARVNDEDRALVYQKIAEFVPPPVGVTREGILRLDQKMLEQWRHSLEVVWGPGGKGMPKNATDWKLLKKWDDPKFGKQGAGNK